MNISVLKDYSVPWSSYIALGNRRQLSTIKPVCRTHLYWTARCNSKSFYILTQIDRCSINLYSVNAAYKPNASHRPEWLLTWVASHIEMV